MRIEQDGTRIYCPRCLKTTVCKAVPPSTLGMSSGQRWQRKDHSDVRWFRRGRICKYCGKSFITAELEESRVDELCKLRDENHRLSDAIEKYLSQSDQASESFRALLGVSAKMMAVDVKPESSFIFDKFDDIEDDFEVPALTQAQLIKMFANLASNPVD